VPCTLSRKLNNEELRSYLHARYSDLGELLLPHADGDLLYLITVKPSRWSDAIATVSGYFFPGAGGRAGGRTRGYGVSISPLGRRGGMGIYLPNGQGVCMTPSAGQSAYERGVCRYDIVTD